MWARASQCRIRYIRYRSRSMRRLQFSRHSITLLTHALVLRLVCFAPLPACDVLIFTRNDACKQDNSRPMPATRPTGMAAIGCNTFKIVEDAQKVVIG